ncbi:hypothetical protein D9M70_603790 [compost metagenome]
MHEGGVVDQDIQTSRVPLYALEQSDDLVVVGQVAGYRDALAASGGHCCGSVVDGARQYGFAGTTRGIVAGGAADHVDGGAAFAEGDGDAAADATAGTGDQGDLVGFTHDGFLVWVAM